METAIRTKRLSKIFTASNGILLISLLYAGMFGWAAIDKLHNHGDFYTALNVSELLHSFALLLSYAVPFVEIFIALLLLFNIPIGKTRSRKVALIASGVLMLLFTIYILAMLELYKGRPLPCTCGGFVKDLSWIGHIFFNLGFIMLAILGLLLYRKHPQPI